MKSNYNFKYQGTKYDYQYKQMENMDQSAVWTNIEIKAIYSLE